MNKKAVVWNFLVYGIIAVVVVVIIIFSFKGLFGKEASTTDSQIESTGTDTDCDGVMNIFDRCCTKDAASRDKVDLTGCAPGDEKEKCPKGYKC